MYSEETYLVKYVLARGTKFLKGTKHEIPEKKVIPSTNNNQLNFMLKTLILSFSWIRRVDFVEDRFITNTFELGLTVLDVQDVLVRPSYHQIWIMLCSIPNLAQIASEYS